MKPCFSKRYKDQLRTFGIIAEPSAYEYIVNISSLYKYHLTRFSLSLFQWFYTVTKDNTLLHCEIQNSVLPHRKQSWIYVWHFLSIIQTYSTWQRWSFLFGVSEFCVWDIALWQPSSFDWFDLLTFSYFIIFWSWIFCFSSVATFVALSNLPTRIEGKI